MQRQLSLLVLYQALWQEDAQALQKTYFICLKVPDFQDASHRENLKIILYFLLRPIIVLILW